MVKPIAAAIARLRRFIGNRDGNVAMIFGLSAIMLALAAGVAVDATRAYTVKMRLGTALDAAALAVGSTTNETPAQLATRLQNYFLVNYPSTALGGATVTIAPTPANESLTASVVTFVAQATVPMTFMKMAGFNTITVSATNQIHKTAGLEVVLVLDNTGSMLCGQQDGAPNYNAALCQGGVVASDTTCIDSNNQSRICTLRNAATQFVNTLTSAITSSEQLYISVVPYVTTVNVGGALCSGATTCSSIATDASSGAWTNEMGGIVTLPTPITITGNTTRNSTTVTNLSPTAANFWPNTNFTAVPLAVGMTIAGSGIANGTTIASVNTGTNTITLSANATATASNVTLTPGFKGNAVSGAGTVNSVSATIGTAANQLNLQAGMAVIEASGTDPQYLGATASGPLAVSIQSVVSGGTQITLSHNAGTSTTGTVFNFVIPVTYVSNNPSTTGWMGCVVEPTSSGENQGVAAVINSTTANPDTTEPVTGMKWYPFWWPPGNGTFSGINTTGTNNWAPNSVSPQSPQSTSIEVQGDVTSDWESYAGPNQGCPVPMLPLTDATTSAGQTQILNTISSMWPRDAGGTAVNVGMIWGWRTLSPTGPFPANNGHPMTYANANTLGWKKVVVLMTDGTEEWPDANGYTGYGLLYEGKVGTTSNTTTAQNTYDSRLQAICAAPSGAMQNGNFIIYTIGLGSDGASNTTLQQCATTSNGGFFTAADTGNLQAVFNNVAQALIALRLSQ
jgi:Flp pilus assembly protein TadG